MRIELAASSPHAQRVKLHYFIAIAAVALSAPALAAPPVLELPVDCARTKICYIQNYVDQDSSVGAKDYTCGGLTYDKHGGTDFAIADLAEMRKGVPVLAAAAGIVAAVRDGMADIDMRAADPVTLKDRALGNAVILEHPDGWRTSYGHLRQGSIRVAKGETVTAGTPLGVIGLSGNTEFPHLHFEVRRNATAIDPFVGAPAGAGCGQSGAALWSAAAQQAFPYRATGLIDMGFAENAPSPAELADGQHQAKELSRTAPALILWARVYGLKPSSSRVLKLSGPDGKVLVEQRLPGGPRAQAVAYAGIKRKTADWPSGRYVGQFSISESADGREQVLLEAQQHLTVR